MSVNNTNKKAKTINGTKGIIIFFLLLFGAKKYKTIPQMAPDQMEIINTAIPLASPKKAPTPKNKTISPKPIALPFETIHTKRKGRAKTIGAIRVGKL